MSSFSETVFVGMSGGVDSSVAALLLKKKGYSVVGVFMRCYNIDGCAERDAEDARRVAEHIGIPFYVWDFEEAYKRKVMDYMIEGYRAGITPNPDVMCNKEIKFGLFLEKALAAGADFVATGHYVKINNKKFSSLSSPDLSFATLNSKPSRIFEGRRRGSALPEYSLFQAKDTNKDQSYFLWTLTQDQLKHCLFPLGAYLKPDVREIARKAGLPTAAKKDSQGICFLGDVSIFDFLKQYIPENPGALVTTSGEKIGKHQGAEFYTIGQRHLGVTCQVSGVRLKDEHRKERGRFYVASKDAKTNTVVVVEGSDNPALLCKEVRLANVHFISPSFANSSELANKEIEVFARVRYRQPLFAANLIFHPRRSATLVFERAQKFIAPGQSAVFYARKSSSSAKAKDGKEMTGGGVIT